MGEITDSTVSWISPGGRRAVLAIAVIIGCIAGVGIVVYLSGGTAFAWVHLMYVPIILSASLFRIPGGIAAAVVGGVVLGPFMPLHVLTDNPQETANWVVRTGFFLIVGTLNGVLFSSLHTQFQRLKKTHEELVSAHEELQGAQLRLIQAAKLESVGRLAAGIAHEVKNPLATIQLGVDFLSRAFKGNREITEVAEDMDHAVRRADTVIKGLLDFSRSEKLDLAVRDLNAVIEDSLLLVRHELARKSVSVEKSLDGTNPSTELDRAKIEQVFINLFINAIHAMSEGGLLTVKTYTMRSAANAAPAPGAGTKEIPGDTLVVAEVDDSGTGIPEEKLGKIFDPFFTTKPVGQGTGLGLSVTRKILELHHASIEIKNREEGGVSVLVMFKPCKGGNDGEEKDPCGR